VVGTVRPSGYNGGMQLPGSSEGADSEGSRRSLAGGAGRVRVGHPVDVATGEQFTAAHDVQLAGVSPLIFRRVYSTANLARPAGALGPGWTHAFEASLERDLDGFVFQGHDGDHVEFNDVEGAFARGADGASIHEPSAAMELRREGERLVVYHWHSAEEPVQKYVFDSRDGEHMLLSARLLPSGPGLTIKRDRQGRAVSVTQTTEQRRLHLDYDPSGRLSTLRLGLVGQAAEHARVVARYEYDELSRLVAVHDATGAARRYSYDEQHRLVLEADRRGGTFHMRYDTEGRCIESVGDDGYRRCTFRYEPRMTQVTNSLGEQTVYHYNAQGQVVLEILPSGAKIGTQFDELGRIICEIDPLGQATQYRYDERGHMVEKVFANGAKITYEYDSYHQPTRVTDPDGASWKFTYDRAALTELEDPRGRRTRYVRGAQNQLLGSVTSAGRELQIRTDELCTEESITDQLGLVTRRRFDIYLNVTEKHDAVGPLGSATYDVLGRLVRSERADGSSRTLEYDPLGAITRLEDARGGVWRARYNAYGHCTEHVDPLGRSHQMDYDSEGRLVAIANPRGETSRFEYDVAGNVVRIQHFDGSVEHAQYDLACRLVARTRPDGTELRMSYDAVGNLLALGALERELRQFKYDIAGALLEATSESSKLEFEYAPGGLLLAEVQNGRRIEYQYGAGGFLRQRTFAGSKLGRLTFEHDVRGRLRRLADGQGTEQRYEYDGRDQCVERILGSEPDSGWPPSTPLRERRQYDLQGRLRHQEVGKLLRRVFTYDAEGALTEIADTSRGSRKLEYDLADQLVRSFNDSLGLQHYYYDAAGNLAGKNRDSFSYAEGNRLTRAGATSFVRDANGRMVRQTSAQRDDQYGWDPLGQLTVVTHRDGSQTRFAYDALGRRVWKDHEKAPAAPRDAGARSRQADVCRTEYFWSGDDLLAEQRGAALTEYVMRGFVADAIWEDGSIRHVVVSPQGVPQELIDAKGKLIWQGSFDDWGKLSKEEGPGSCRLRLPGQLFDEETGLSYNRFRYYSADAGQFISPDPIGFGGGTNLFRFAPNAVGWLDTLGLECPDGACLKWSEDSEKHALDRHSPHRPPGPDGKGTEFPREWSEKEFIDAVQKKANDPATVRTPVPPERGGVGSTAFEPITINGVTRKIFIVIEVPDPAIAGTGPGVITSAFPRHKNK